MKIIKFNKKMWTLFICFITVLSFTACSEPPRVPDETIEYKTTLSGQFSADKKLTVFNADSFSELEFESGTITTNTFYFNDKLPGDSYGANVYVKALSAERYGDKVYIIPEYYVADDICIPTQYGMLHFSSEWTDYLQVISDGTVYKFVYTDEIQSLELFSVSFAEAGALKGTVKKGNVPVCLQMVSLPGDSSDRIYAMAEGANYLVSQLNQLDGFEAAE